MPEVIKISFDGGKYNNMLAEVLSELEDNPAYKALLESKNLLFEENPEMQEVLLELDELLSNYYKEALERMYYEIAKKVIETFCSVE